ncbi:MAG: hypothetical protein IJD38_03865 [Clostridia bacterium]|nr:hypothetical protein [Clostridia bacterium]
MTDRNILDAFGGISPDLIEEAAPHGGQKERDGRAWVKWGAVAACFTLTLAIFTSLGGKSIMTAAVVNYGPAIFLPILLATILSFGFSFTGKEKGRWSLLLTNGIFWAAINILTVLGVCVYSTYGGINMIGKLSIILVSANVGLCVSLGIGMAIIRAKKEWWQRLMLYLLLWMISVAASCLAHSVMAMLMNGDLFTAL